MWGSPDFIDDTKPKARSLSRLPETEISGRINNCQKQAAKKGGLVEFKG